MLFKIAFRVALAAGIVYGVKKVMDRTGVTDKLVALGEQAMEKVADFAVDNFFLADATPDESESAMSTPEAANWAKENVTTGGGAGGQW